MNLYPAIKFKMGNWDYFVVKMSFQELADSVKFAHEIYNDYTLDDAIQRALNEKRVQKEIVSYLKQQPNRFFSSIVVAAMEGDPKFYPVEIADDERFAVFRDDKRLNNTFGVLAFDGTQKYYALDGQHRLAAMRAVLDRQSDLSQDAPDEIAEDEISVVVVVPTHLETDENFLKRYRRLFSNLNRYAKPMDQATNIVLDEDDAFAIVTRRLITEHEFFRTEGRQRESLKVKTTKGKNLKSGDPYFTNLEILYELNIELLNSRRRRNAGWGNSESPARIEDFKRFRPEESLLDALYAELTMYWDGLLSELPVLQSDPSVMREHGGDEEPQRGASDHLLFWPIGQILLAQLARQLLDAEADRLGPEAELSTASVKRALAGLSSLEWELHRPPWRYFLLIQRDGRWLMRDEDRKGAIEIGKMIQLWTLGLYEASTEEEEHLRLDWATRLVPNQPDESEDAMWETVVALKDSVA